MNPGQRTIKKMTWVYISGVVFIIFLAAAIAVIIFADRLAQFGITKSFYYVILIPLGLCAAGFLFGAMRSHAKYTGKGSYGQIELTGPVVIFCLVVAGGFYFAEPESGFILTVRPSTDNNKIINHGSVTIGLGNQRIRRDIGENGEVLLADVPSRFKDKEISIIPDIEGYRAKKNMFKVPADNVIVMELVPEDFVTNVKGTVIDSHGNVLSGVQINFESGTVLCESNNYGNFSAALPVKAGTTMLVIASRNGKTGYRDFIAIPANGSITIPFNDNPQ